jgi:hypothetical protein
LGTCALAALLGILLTVSTWACEKDDGCTLAGCGKIRMGRPWFNDDSTVNKTFTGVLELPSIGTNIYQYASKTHLVGFGAGFFPLDTLNPSQASLCNLWPYWNRTSGSPIWTSCSGDQYLFPPRVTQSDCPNQNPLSNGCWITNTSGVKHDSTGE